MTSSKDLQKGSNAFLSTLKVSKLINKTDTN